MFQKLRPYALKARSGLLLSCFLVLCLLLVYVWFPTTTPEQLSGLRYPAESAGRVWDRHLQFYEGYEAVPRWERVFHEFLFGNRREVEDEAVQAYREVLNYFADHREAATPWASLNTQARLLVTLAETGRWEELETELALSDSTLEADAIRAAARYAYTDSVNIAGTELVTNGVSLMPLGWSASRLQLAIAKKRGDLQTTEAHAARLRQDGERLRFRTLALAATIACICLTGLIAVSHACGVRQPPPWPPGILAQPWNLGQGFAVALYSVLLGVLVVVLLSFTAASYFRPGVWTLWSTLFASLPMIMLIHYKLLKPRKLGFAQAFGLSLSGVGMSRFILITLALLAVDAGGAMLISWTGWKLGLDPHWSHGLQERMIFGPWQSTMLSGINVVLWAPIFEELAFRGLVYISLRARYGPVTAAWLSASLFSALHLYSLPGFLSVLWSGLVLAYAFERYRSLLPGIVAHGLNNAIALSIMLLFYR